MADSLSQDLASLRIQRETPPPKQGRPSRLLVTVGAVIAVVGAVGAAVSLRPKVEAQFFKTEVAVTQIVAVSPSQAAVDVTSTGYVVPQILAKVGSKVVGRIARVHVQEGAIVAAGQRLFEIDSADQRSALAAARARVAAARARVQSARAAVAEIEVQWKRQRKLAESGAVGVAAVEDLEARLEALRAQAAAQQADVEAAIAEAASLETGLKNLTIAAPIDGIALGKPAQIGDVVSTDAALVELADPKSLLVETDVPEGRMHLVKLGGPCEIVLDALPGERFRGVVGEVGPRLNRAKATALIKVRFVDRPPRLQPEMSARVSFLSKPIDEETLKKGDKVIVPAGAAVERSGAMVVFVIDGEKARMLGVSLGERVAGGVELISGPPPGTRIVKDPPANLADGQAIKERTP